MILILFLSSVHLANATPIQCRLLLERGKADTDQVAAIAPSELIPWLDPLYEGYGRPTNATCNDSACFPSATSRPQSAGFERVGSLIRDLSEDPSVFVFRIDYRLMLKRAHLFSALVRDELNQVPWFQREAFRYLLLGVGVGTPLLAYLAKTFEIPASGPIIGVALAAAAAAIVPVEVSIRRGRQLSELDSNLSQFARHLIRGPRALGDFPTVLVGASATVRNSDTGTGKPETYLFSDLVRHLRERGTSTVHWDLIVHWPAEQTVDPEAALAVRVR